MPEQQIVFVVLLYVKGEFQRVQLYSTKEKAIAAAARHVYDSFDDDFVDAMVVDDPAFLLEWVDAMKVLFVHEDYVGFVNCWDAWVANGNFEGPTIHNFDIEELAVDA